MAAQTGGLRTREGTPDHPRIPAQRPRHAETHLAAKKLDEPIRRLDKYEVSVRFGEEVKATINVWVVPPRDQQGDEAASGEGEQEPAPADEAEKADPEA